MARSLWNSMSLLFAVWITHLATSSSNSNENIMRTRRIVVGNQPIGDQTSSKYTGDRSTSIPLFYLIIIASNIDSHQYSPYFSC